MQNIFVILRTYLLLLFFVLSAGVLSPQALKDITPQRLAQFEQYVELADNARLSGDLKAQALNLSKAAFILWESNRLYDAIDMFEESAELFKKLEDYKNLRSVYSNMGMLYADNQDLQQASYYFNECLRISRLTGEENLIASGLYDVAFISTSLTKYDESNSRLMEALDIATRLNDQKLLLNIFGLLASNYRMLNDYNEAAKYQEQYNITLRLLQQQIVKSEYEQREVRNLGALQRSALEIKAQKQEAELNSLRLKSSQDSLARIAEEAQRHMLTIENLEKDAQLKEATILAQKLKQSESDALLKHQKAVEQRQQIVIIAVILIVILMAIVGTVLFKSNLDRKKTNVILQHNNEEIVEKSEELKKAFSKIERQTTQIKQSINYAKGIQQAMIPPAELLKDFFNDSFVYWKPRDIVSGDFYWFKPIYDDHEMETGKNIFADKDLYNLSTADKLLIATVDCTGHGVPGAFMSMIGNNLLDEITQRGITRPDLILYQLRLGIITTLKQNTTGNKDGMDIALCLVDKKTKKLYYSGVNNPLIYIQNEELRQIKPDSIALGGVQTTDARFTLHEISLDKPTYCYIFSDGYVDQFGGQLNRKFMIANFRKLLLEIHGESFEEQANLLDVTMDGWMDKTQPQIDDILVVGFKLDL